LLSIAPPSTITAFLCTSLECKNIKKICHCRRNMFVQLEVFIFCPTVKIEIQSLLALRFDYYGTRVTHPASICFWIIKRSYLNLHLPFVAFRKLFLLFIVKNY
jgi:hypothetical protein